MLEALAQNFRELADWSLAKDAIASTATDAGAKPGQLMFPLRIALSGRQGGPDLGSILQILGPEECLRRLERFNNLLR